MFQRIFASLVLFLFGSLFIAPVFWAEHLEGKNLTILTQVSDFCSTSIECKKTQNGSITCERKWETLSTQRWSIHGIESEKTFGCREWKGNSFLFHDTKTLPYTFSDTSVASFIYPFVSIIKIQV